MAFSLINYFVFENKEYRGIFLIVDAIVIAGLHFLEQKLRRGKEQRRVAQEAGKMKQTEMEKKAAIGRQAKSRADHVLPSDKQAKISKHSKPNPINQPFTRSGKKAH